MIHRVPRLLAQATEKLNVPLPLCFLRRAAGRLGQKWC